MFVCVCWSGGGGVYVLRWWWCISVCMSVSVCCCGGGVCVCWGCGVCVCCGVVFLCCCMCTYVHEEARGHWVSSSIIPCSISLRQCLSLNLELGWQPASLSDPLVLKTNAILCIK